jgi:hypothetical protein
MCPACMAMTAMLIASAVSTGGAAAVLAEKLLGKKIVTETKIFRKQQGEKRS